MSDVHSLSPKFCWHSIFYSVYIFLHHGMSANLVPLSDKSSFLLQIVRRLIQIFSVWLFPWLGLTPTSQSRYLPFWEHCQLPGSARISLLARGLCLCSPRSGALFYHCTWLKCKVTQRTVTSPPMFFLNSKLPSKDLNFLILQYVLILPPRFSLFIFELTVLQVTFLMLIVYPQLP